MRLFIPSILAALLTLAQPMAGTAKTVPTGLRVIKQYHLAKARYNAIRFSAQKAADYRAWLLCARAFQQSYKTDPYHPLAPSSLLTLGHLHYRMYKKFGKPDDLDEALSYYDDLVTLFPRHSYADDALYKTAKIYALDLGDYKNAALVFARLLAVYPDGDMVRKAAADLKAIKAGRLAAGAPVSKDSQAGESKEILKRSPPGKRAAKERAEVRKLRHWSTDNYTRVVIETSAPVDFKDNLLKKDGDRPRRLYLDLHNTRIPKRLQQAIPIRDGLLQRVRSAQYKPDVARVVMDTQSLSEYNIFTLDDPFRIVIDVKGTSTPVLAATGRKKEPPRAARTGAVSPPPPRAKGAPSLAQQLGLHITRVILDPGHGGKDPGAVGVDGLREKDVVLKVAKKLARKLERNLGCEVLLTRKRDVFLPLEERTAIANMKEGDLFISIHANAARSARARGVETYYLDFAQTTEERMIAAKENAVSSQKISDLQNLLNRLMLTAKKNESAKLAGAVQAAMVRKLSSHYRGITNHGVKRAPFIVLIGAQMPSILTEIAFVTNKTEARRLRDDNYLETLAESIADGVTRYATALNVAYRQ